MNQTDLKRTSVIKNEDGSVLLFSIVILFLLVVITTTIGLVVVNRANVVKATADKNTLLTYSEQYLLGSENALRENIFQNDELARYYISMKYYDKANVNFSTSVVYGGDPRLDAYLRNLITPTFQTSLYNSRTSVTNDDMLNTVFAYITIRRINRDFPGISTPLPSIENALIYSQSSDGKYKLNQSLINIKTDYIESGVTNQRDPRDFMSLSDYVNGDGKLVNATYRGVHDTSAESTDLASISGDVVITVNPLKYEIIGDVITVPTLEEISEKAINVKEYRITKTAK